MHVVIHVQKFKNDGKLLKFMFPFFTIGGKLHKIRDLLVRESFFLH